MLWSESSPICMSVPTVSRIRTPDVGSCVYLFDVDGIVPSLRNQNGFSILSVKIQQRLQVGFVVIHVRLVADESSIQLNRLWAKLLTGAINSAVLMAEAARLPPFSSFNCRSISK